MMMSMSTIGYNINNILHNKQPAQHKLHQTADTDTEAHLITAQNKSHTPRPRVMHIIKIKFHFKHTRDQKIHIATDPIMEYKHIFINYCVFS